ncbi:uncharacterized protein [Hoplias malabaricus]|uniref:uncharacterized protein n=1 Tax=Hoplias malabaricus TaxID=27720 RepID=UPI003461D966
MAEEEEDEEEEDEEAGSPRGRSSMRSDDGALTLSTVLKLCGSTHPSPTPPPRPPARARARPFPGRVLNPDLCETEVCRRKCPAASSNDERRTQSPAAGEKCTEGESEGQRGKVLLEPGCDVTEMKGSQKNVPLQFRVRVSYGAEGVSHKDRERSQRVRRKKKQTSKMEEEAKPSVMKESTRNTLTAMMMLMAGDVIRDLYQLYKQQLEVKVLDTTLVNINAQIKAATEVLKILVDQLRPLRHHPLIGIMKDIMSLKEEDGKVVEFLEKLLKHQSSDTQPLEHDSGTDLEAKTGSVYSAFTGEWWKQCEYMRNE